MIDKSILNQPLTAEKNLLPFFEKVAAAPCYVYAWRDYHFGYECSVAAWWKRHDGQHAKFLYYTGDLFHDLYGPESSPRIISRYEKMAALLASEGLSSPEAHDRLINGAPLPDALKRSFEVYIEEIQREYEGLLQVAEPVICEERDVRARELEKLLALFPDCKRFSGVVPPPVIDGGSNRVLARATDGIEYDIDLAFNHEPEIDRLWRRLRKYAKKVWQ